MLRRSRFDRGLRQARGRTPGGARSGLARMVSAGATLLALGAGAMFLLDPRQGRRRRALIRDKTAHAYNVVTQRAPRETGRQLRYRAGRLRGVRHDVAHRWWHVRGGRDIAPDDVTLAQRVRTEVFAPPDIPDGGVNIDAYAGVVTLRGQLPDHEMIDRMVRMARHVEGVSEVRNLMHTPGEPVPPH